MLKEFRAFRSLLEIKIKSNIKNDLRSSKDAQHYATKNRRVRISLKDSARKIDVLTLENRLKECAAAPMATSLIKAVVSLRLPAAASTKLVNTPLSVQKKLLVLTSALA